MGVRAQPRQLEDQVLRGVLAQWVFHRRHPTGLGQAFGGRGQQLLGHRGQGSLQAGPQIVRGTRGVGPPGDELAQPRASRSQAEARTAPWNPANPSKPRRAYRRDAVAG